MRQTGGVRWIEEDKSRVQRLDLLGLQPGTFLNSITKALQCEPIHMPPSGEKEAVEPIVKRPGIRHRGPEKSGGFEHTLDFNECRIQLFKVFQGVIADHQIDAAIRQRDGCGIADDVKASRISISGKREIHRQNSSPNPA